MSQPTSTANYRQYPKGPNFRLIVILAGVIMLVIFVCVWLVLRTEGRKMLPKVPDKHPTSQVTPLRPPPIVSSITFC